MNKEIKEILYYLKKKENTRRIKCITIEESKQLLDYITNLEKEIERLKKICDKYEEEYNTTYMIWEKDLLDSRKSIKLFEDDLTNMTKQALDYKSRIDKAIEKIKSKYIAQGGLTSYEVNDLLNELENILTGDDNE